VTKRKRRSLPRRCEDAAAKGEGRGKTKKWLGGKKKRYCSRRRDVRYKGKKKKLGYEIFPEEEKEKGEKPSEKGAFVPIWKECAPKKEIKGEKGKKSPPGEKRKKPPKSRWRQKEKKKSSLHISCQGREEKRKKKGKKKGRITRPRGKKKEVPTAWKISAPKKKRGARSREKKKKREGGSWNDGKKEKGLTFIGDFRQGKKKKNRANHETGGESGKELLR